MDGKQVLKILHLHGFKCLRIRGSHHIMSDGKSKPFPVPIHNKKDLKIGTLKSIERSTRIKLL